MAFSFVFKVTTKMKMKVVKQLFAIPKIVGADDSRLIIRESLDTLTPFSIATMHERDTFFAICQQLGVNTNIDSCNTIEQREALTNEIYSLLRRFF